MPHTRLNDEDIERILEDPDLRRALVYHSHEYFASLYLQEQFTYDFAFFHREMIAMTEEPLPRLNVVMAFRGSGKSTLMNLSHALWAVLGAPQKKFVVVVSKTRVQALAHFSNIKAELEDNDLLRNDLGPFKPESHEWGAYSLELPHIGAKIMIIPALGSLRGLKYKRHRPDLIICDDVEDTESVKTPNGRERLYSWFKHEVLLAGTEHTKIVVLGNLLHEESLLMRLKKDIENGMPGLFKAYPLLDDRNKILWSSRYKNAADVENLKQSTGADEDVWKAEYLLRMGDQLVIVWGDYKSPAALPISTGSRRSDYVIGAPVAGGDILVIGEPPRRFRN